MNHQRCCHARPARRATENAREDARTDVRAGAERHSHCASHLIAATVVDGDAAAKRDAAADGDRHLVRIDDKLHLRRQRRLGWRGGPRRALQLDDASPRNL
eukprot:6409565-Prymnesium_polylepis.1